jgi:hypothetical protein
VGESHFGGLEGVFELVYSIGVSASGFQLWLIASWGVRSFPRSYEVNRCGEAGSSGLRPIR